ncbi:MAG: DUF1573 domain-containing protein [Planctomycetaceae bacterium]|jgi:hypothetical protein|nr:DUF1573 domain-containing protein [Planctomycetaceae bacterium]
MSARFFVAICLLFLATNSVIFLIFFGGCPSLSMLPVTENRRVKNYLPQEPFLVPATKTSDSFFVEPEEIDFGNVAEGNIVKGKVNLVNHTNSEIEIVRIVTSCGFGTKYDISLIL